MRDTIIVLITAIASILGSSGFWAYISKKNDKSDAIVDMLRGLGHDRICELGMFYIDRGWITKDEYENLHDYLYVPYCAINGNGSAKRVMKGVDKLKMYDHPPTESKSK